MSISMHSVLFHHSTARFLKSLKTPNFPSQFPKFFFFKPITIERITSQKPGCNSSSPSASLQPIEELPPKLQEIVKLFRGVQESKAKYEQLLFYRRNLTQLGSQYKTTENKVQGCVSQVWVRAYLDCEKNVIFEADSDSVLTKGLAALLVQGLSGSPVDEIVRVSPDFVVLLGLQQSLTPSRNNGFLNMLKLMQKKALQLYVESERGDDFDTNVALSGHVGISNLVLNGDGNGGAKLSGTADDFNTRVDNVSILGDWGTRIKEILERALSPVELQVEDISHQHGESDGETHFNVKVVSQQFEGKSSVKRHRLIYSLVQNELHSGLQALSIVAKTPAEV